MANDTAILDQGNYTVRLKVIRGIAGDANVTLYVGSMPISTCSLHPGAVHCEHMIQLSAAFKEATDAK